MTIFLIILGSVILISLLSACIIIGMKNLAKRNTHFTRLGNEQGKLVMKEENVVEVLSNMKGLYYNNNGELVKAINPKKNGSLFKEFGIIFFGITPIKNIYQFSSEWNEYTEKKAKGVKGEQISYEIIKKNEKLDYFKRVYTHAIEILRVELNDGSKIDLVFLVTFEVLNIIQVIFKIKPDGIILAQAETGFAGAIQEQCKLLSYSDFRNTTNKSDPDSPFVKNVIEETNKIIENKFHLRADLIEMKFYDLSKGEEGDEDFQKAQMAQKIAELDGNAKILFAQKMALAKQAEGEGIKKYLEEISKIIGVENISSFANLEQVSKTHLLSYGTGASPVVPMVNAQTK
ncbi:MAG: hypothetical protein WC264_01325 [Candidatus Paceibacterota bacterium]|jgi:hypothetical protein